MTAAQLALLAIGLSTFGSFGWSIRRFFTAPQGMQAGMRWIYRSGSAFMALHLAAIAFPRQVHAEIGCALYGAALALFWWAVRVNRAQPLSLAYSQDEPRHLVTDGPYRWIRHPFYASYTVAWLAAPLATGHYLLLLTVAWMLMLYVRAALHEEAKFAASGLGGAYAAYQRRAGLLWPRA